MEEEFTHPPVAGVTFTKTPFNIIRQEVQEEEFTLAAIFLATITLFTKTQHLIVPTLALLLVYVNELRITSQALFILERL